MTQTTQHPLDEVIPADVEHTTSSGLQIIEVHDHGIISWVLIDHHTRHTFPMDDVQWRELQMFIVTRNAEVPR